MPPSALRLMIVQLAVHSTFRARPTRQLLVRQMDVDLSVGQLQLNRLDVPRRLDPENALIKVSILHSRNCLTPFSATAQTPLQSRNSLKCIHGKVAQSERGLLLGALLRQVAP